MSSPAPETLALCSWPPAVRSTESYQSVLALPSSDILSGGRSRTTARDRPAASQARPRRAAPWGARAAEQRRLVGGPLLPHGAELLRREQVRPAGDHRGGDGAA